MKPATSPSLVIDELEDLLNKGNAHVSFDEAVKGVPQDLLGKIPDGLPYSIWQLVEHIRIAQWDILEFCRNTYHKSLEWPKDYWPKEPAPPHTGDWKKSIDQIHADRVAFIQLLHNAGDGLYIPFAHGHGQSLFREALVIADHTSYHTGEIILLRRLLGNWK